MKTFIVKLSKEEISIVSKALLRLTETDPVMGNELKKIILRVVAKTLIAASH